jgi:cupin 2 domain-containing protein
MSFSNFELACLVLVGCWGGSMTYEAECFARIRSTSNSEWRMFAMHTTAEPVFGRLAQGGARPMAGEETFLDLLTAPGGSKVERILSRGAASPPDFWYEQQWDEFVLVVTGTAVLAFPDDSERRLEAGDYAILPAFCRHRVAWTDPAIETLWLAVHMPPRPRPLH